METLRDSCKLKIKTIFNNLKMETNSPSFLLITDQTSLKILTNIVKMNEIVEYGICAIQRLELVRKKFKTIEAVYLISPTQQSIYRLLKDYESQQKIQYQSVHIFFTSRIEDEKMQKIATNQCLLKRIKTFKQLNLEFICQTPSQFTINLFNKDSFKNLLFEKGNTFNKQITEVVERISTIVSSFSKFYSVEIFHTNSKNIKTPAEQISKQLANKLNYNFEIYDKCSYEAYDPKAAKINIVIIDRSFDPISPLVRDFHYFSLLIDLGHVQNYKVKYMSKNNKKQQSKTLTLDQNDSVFMKYKYKHIGKVLKEISEDFKEFTEKDEGAKFQKQKHYGNLSNMTGIMRKITDYSSTKQRYGLHMNLLQSLNKQFKDLKKIGDLEQSIITGKNEDEQQVPDKTIITNLSNLLQVQKNKQTKARLIVLALLSMNLKNKQKVMLEQALAGLGPQYEGLKKSIAYLSQQPMRLTARKNTDILLDRHFPKIQQTLIQLLIKKKVTPLQSIKINMSKFTNSNVGSTTTVVRKKIQKQEQVNNNQKLIVYVVGAMGYNEIRCINKLSSTYTVICGSNQIVTPKRYLQLINTLTEEDQL